MTVLIAFSRLYEIDSVSMCIIPAAEASAASWTAKCQAANAATARAEEERDAARGEVGA